jgi:hypothetical protein
MRAFDHASLAVSRIFDPDRAKPLDELAHRKKGPERDHSMERLLN